MVKPASVKDEKLLKQYAKSEDKKLAEEAKCLLAGYYVKQEQYAKSEQIFSGSTGELFVDDELGIQLAYWRIVSDMENSKDIKKSDIDLLSTAKTARAITLKRDLCKKYTVDFLGILCENGAIKDVELGLESPEKPLLVDNESEQQLSTDAIIEINSASMDDDLVKGILYAIKENDFKYRIQLGDSNGDVQVDANKNKVTVLENKIAFSENFSPDLNRIFEYVWSKNSDLVIIGVNQMTVGIGSDLKAALENVGVDVITLGYEEQDFRQKLNVINEEYGEKEIFYFGFGTQKAMTKFVPLVRFMSQKPELVEISVAVDLFSDLYFDDEFKQYFKNVEVLTYLNSNANYWSKKFENGYTHFYGQKPSAASFYGYDMMVKINTFTDIKAKADYVSNINDFLNGQAMRELIFHKIINSKQVKVLEEYR